MNIVQQQRSCQDCSERFVCVVADALVALLLPPASTHALPLFPLYDISDDGDPSSEYRVF